MNEHYSDRRRWPRHSVLVPCRIEGISNRTSVRLTELSIGGGYVDANTPLQVGDPIGLVMDLDGRELAVPGRVLYLIPRTGFGFAFEWDDMPLEAREAIEQFLKSREAGVGQSS